MMLVPFGRLAFVLALLQASTPALPYPSSYRGLSLPELIGATVTSTGRQATSLKDGLSLSLTSSMAVDDIRAFYRKAMTDLGWTEAAQGRGARAAALPVARVEFSKGALTFRATITRGPASTTVSLSIIER